MFSERARAGPSLPPHILEKRKRQEAEKLQEQRAENGLNSDRLPSPDSPNKRRRQVIGPTPPPAPSDERPPTNPTSDNSDSSDDEFGPTLPGEAPSGEPGRSAFDDEPETQEEESKPSRRDDWMTMPPKQDDLSARMDPTKIRARGFNTGKSAGQAGGGDNALWTETPEQKRKRLEDEVLGISRPAASGRETSEPSRSKKDAEDEEKARKIREYNEKHRSQSLYSQHQGSTKKEKEDDPSARGFDYERDMAVGSKIGHAQRKDMVNKSAGFSSRFSSGSYL